MDVAREPAVAAGVRAAVGRLDHEVAPAVRPRPLGEDGVAEGHEPTDHPRAARVELLHGRAEVVRRPLGADRPRERHAGTPADDAGLVLEIELDGVDPLLVEQPQHVRPQAVVRPGVGAHVHRAHGIAREPRRRPDLEPAVGDVARLVVGEHDDRPRRGLAKATSNRPCSSTDACTPFTRTRAAGSTAPRSV